MARATRRLSGRKAETITNPGYHADGDGLYLVVDASGARRAFIYHSAGRRREMGLGRMGLKEAREAADEVRRQIRKSKSPSGKFGFITRACNKSPEHDADHSEANESDNRCGIAFEVTRQAAIAANPGECPFDNPSLGQHCEADAVGSLHDLQLPRSSAPNDERHLFAGIATISKDALDEWEQSSRPMQQQESAVTVLNIGRMNHNVQEETQRIDQDVPLAALNLLARVEARRIERRPPF